MKRRYFRGNGKFDACARFPLQELQPKIFSLNVICVSPIEEYSLGTPATLSCAGPSEIDFRPRGVANRAYYLSHITVVVVFVIGLGRRSTASALISGLVVLAHNR